MATGQSSKTENQVSLKGSVETVTEFFGYAITNILYQRGIYPSNSFIPTTKYGISILVSNDKALVGYLNRLLSQMTEWLKKGQVQKLVVVISSMKTKDVLERWVFNVETDKDGILPGATRVKSTRDLQAEIQAIMRQITACVTFLPLLQEPCTFDLLLYADTEVLLPDTWEETDPRYIQASEEVKLRNFNTSIHKIAPIVSYRI
jgi:mitotic spindle assembly checkpoint protein MAD2